MISLYTLFVKTCVLLITSQRFTTSTFAWFACIAPCIGSVGDALLPSAVAAWGFDARWKNVVATVGCAGWPGCCVEWALAGVKSKDEFDPSLILSCSCFDFWSAGRFPHDLASHGFAFVALPVSLESRVLFVVAVEAGF